MNKSIAVMTLKTGVILGLINKKSIVDWADYQIRNGDTDHELFELVLLKDKSGGDIIECLDKIVSEETSDVQQVFGIFMCLFSQLERQMPDEWFRIEKLITLLIDYLNIGEKDDFLTRITDDYSLRKDGFQGNMDQPAELRNYLRSFSGNYNVLDDLARQGIVFSDLQ